MATTTMSRTVYMLGKWLSNFVLLSVMILILMGAGIVMILLVGTPLEIWSLIAPLLIIGLPAMAFTAAMAVLFESIRWLRGGLGNLIYFMLFLVLLIVVMEASVYNPFLDISGFSLIANYVAQSALAVYPESTGEFTFTIAEFVQPKFFPFTGIPWTTGVVLPRVAILLAGLGLAAISAVFFDRFNPSRLVKTKKRERTVKRIQEILPRTNEISTMDTTTEVKLTALGSHQFRFRFGSLYGAELRLLIKGQSWWWYLIAGGLVIAQLTSELPVTRILLVVSWIWPVLILSGIGNREKRFNTQQMVFSAPHPVLNSATGYLVGSLYNDSTYRLRCFT